MILLSFSIDLLYVRPYMWRPEDNCGSHSLLPCGSWGQIKVIRLTEKVPFLDELWCLLTRPFFGSWIDCGKRKLPKRQRVLNNKTSLTKTPSTLPYRLKRSSRLSQRKWNPGLMNTQTDSLSLKCVRLLPNITANISDSTTAALSLEESKRNWHHGLWRHKARGTISEGSLFKLTPKIQALYTNKHHAKDVQLSCWDVIQQFLHLIICRARAGPCRQLLLLQW